MQGFNMGRYRPPDADPTKTSFNEGRHALGKRARKLDSEGVLIVRFELPFHVWCAHCNAHLAQGTRYNAHKAQAGDYLGCKIWSFQCKCSCGAWFDIRTDPQNARYKVHQGAREQMQDWDPEQNGGFPIYDSEASPQRDTMVQSEQEFQRAERNRRLRLRELETLADSRGSDPYTLNSALRATFRTEKRKRTSQLEKDAQLRNRLGWHHDRQLLPPDTTPRTTDADAHSWSTQRLEAQRPFSTASTSATTLANTPANNLRNRLVANTRNKSDPFMQQVRRSLRTPSHK